MGFLEKKLKKGLKKGLKEMGMKDVYKHKKKKDKKDKKQKWQHSAPPPPHRAPPVQGTPQQSYPAPPYQNTTQMRGPGSDIPTYINYLMGQNKDLIEKGGKKLKKYFSESPNMLQAHIPQLLGVFRNPYAKARREVAKLIAKGAKKSPMLFKEHMEALQNYLGDGDEKVRDNLRKAITSLNEVLGGGMGNTQVTNIYHAAPQTQAPPPVQPHPAPTHPAPTPQPAFSPPPSVLESGKPGVHLDVIEEELPYKQWGMIQLKVENHSEVDIYNIQVEVKGPVEVSPIDTIHHIPAGESNILEIGMRSPSPGRVPAHLTAIYYDRNRKEYRHSRQDWVNVEKPEKQSGAGTQINIGSIGDIVSDHSTQIHDSVIQRSNIGSGGGSGGSGGGKTVIKGTTMQRSNVAGGGDVTVEDSVMIRSEITGGGPPSCGNCGNELEEGWAMCPKCGSPI